MTLIYIILFICCGLLLYTLLLYPCLLWLLSKIFNKPIKLISENFTPDISIVISAYNEEELIQDAIISIFKSGYPINKISVYVGSDGSTDGTLKIIKKLAEDFKNIFFFDFPRSGKNFVLNQLVPKTSTQYVFFMDADIRVKSGTFEKMIEILNNPEVGAVISSMQLLSNKSINNAGGEGETQYQKFESFIRSWESNILSTVNSLGALYAIKKEFYKPLPNDLVCDDMMPLYDALLFKKRVIFDNKSVVFEVRKKTLDNELSRRVRVAAGGMATLFHAKSLLFPSYGWVSFFLLSHKFFRWLTPILILVIFVLTFLLPSHSILFIVLAIIQTIIYFSSIIGYLFEKMNLKFKPFKLSLYFISMNIGFILAWIRFFLRKPNAAWERIDSQKG